MAKPVFEKLEIQKYERIVVLNSPSAYPELVEIPDPEFVFHNSLAEHESFIHYFAAFRADLERDFPRLKSALSKQGTLWISWPKGKSKLPKDLNENIIRDTGLAIGLVDVKVCAVDEDWSGLKFVYRLKDR